MNVVIAFIFSLYSVFSVNTLCDHALHSAVKDETQIQHSVTHHHDHANHAAVAHKRPPSHSEHAGCPDECDGGPDCENCAAMPAGLEPTVLNLSAPSPESLYLATDIEGHSKTYALEPPPPRTI